VTVTATMEWSRVMVTRDGEEMVTRDVERPDHHVDMTTDTCWAHPVGALKRNLW